MFGLRFELGLGLELGVRAVVCSVVHEVSDEVALAQEQVAPQSLQDSMHGSDRSMQKGV